MADDGLTGQRVRYVDRTSDAWFELKITSNAKAASVECTARGLRCDVGQFEDPSYFGMPHNISVTITELLTFTLVNSSLWGMRAGQPLDWRAEWGPQPHLPAGGSVQLQVVRPAAGPVRVQYVQVVDYFPVRMVRWTITVHPDGHAECAVDKGISERPVTCSVNDKVITLVGAQTPQGQ